MTWLYKGTFSVNVGKLFSRILTRHLEKFTKEINIRVLRNIITAEKLIEWKVWSSMLKVASKYIVSKGPVQFYNIQRLTI